MLQRCQPQRNHQVSHLSSWTVCSFVSTVVKATKEMMLCSCSVVIGALRTFWQAAIFPDVGMDPVAWPPVP